MHNELNQYLEAIKADYRKYSEPRKDEDAIGQAVRLQMLKEFEDGVAISEGPTYFKVVTKSGSSRSVHSFIVKEDGPKFKKGDILKPAGWNAPAKNQARGNIFGQYQIRWTGPNYLR